MRRQPRILQKARRVDDAVDQLRVVQRQVRILDIERARLLAEIDEAYHFILDAHASLGEFGERFGISEYETRRLAAVGRAVALRPELADHIIEARISLDAAQALEKILRFPRLTREGEDWLRIAVDLTSRAFIDRVRERRVACRIRERPVRMTLFISRQCRKNFLRAQKLLSTREKRRVTEEETQEFLLDYYLRENDPLKKTVRRRSSGQAGKVSEPALGLNSKEFEMPRESAILSECGRDTRAEARPCGAAPPQSPTLKNRSLPSVSGRHRIPTHPIRLEDVTKTPGFVTREGDTLGPRAPTGPP